MSHYATVAALQIVKRKGIEMLDEVIDLLEGSRVANDDGISEPAADSSAGGWSAGVNDSSALHKPPPSGGWQEIARDPGEKYRWPDGNLDEYTDYVRYRGTGAFTGANCALGYLPN